MKPDASNTVVSSMTSKNSLGSLSNLWSALTCQRFAPLRPVATLLCKTLRHTRQTSRHFESGVNPLQTKAVTGHRTPKLA